MSLDRKEAAKQELEEALNDERVGDMLLPRVPEAIKEAEEAGLSYEEIVKIIVSYRE